MKCRLCGLDMVQSEEMNTFEKYYGKRLDSFYHWWFDHGLKVRNDGDGDAAFASEIALGIHTKDGSGFTCPVCRVAVNGTGCRELDAWLLHIHEDTVDFESHWLYMMLVGAC